MDSTEAALCDLAALEETSHQSQEADSNGDKEGKGLHLGLQRTECLVELESITYALYVSSQMVHSAGTHKPAFTTSTFSELITNRRMPNGTYGGVRGWGREAPAYSMGRRKLRRRLFFIRLRRRPRALRSRDSCTFG